MINTSSLLANILINGVLYSLMSLLAEGLLKVSGLARGNTIGVVTVAFTIAVFSESLNYDAPLYVYAVLLFILGPISVNRADLTTTLRQGLWWWRTEKHLERIESSQESGQDSQ
jgi:hypothetical protein